MDVAGVVAAVVVAVVTVLIDDGHAACVGEGRLIQLGVVAMAILVVAVVLWVGVELAMVVE